MKLIYIRYFLGLYMTIIGGSAIAQIEIKSKVVNFSTFIPVENASIYIKNTTIGTISNSDGKFALVIPGKYKRDTLVFSSIGYKNYTVAIDGFDTSQPIYLEEDIASLDEVVIVAETRPKTANDIVLRALEKLEENLPDQPYLQTGFLRHKERNKKEYKWLIESALTLYDSSYASGAKNNLKVNIDQMRKSYDLRDVDSLFSYYSYLKHTTSINLKTKQLQRDTIATKSLIAAIKWNDERVNGLENLFKGKLNIIRNSNSPKALFGKDILDKHQFQLDTILVDNGRKLYKIKILKSNEYVGLDTKNIYNEGYQANGWLYIYWDNFAIKKIDYELIAASEAQKRRSKSLFDTRINHKLIITYIEYQERMYPNYIYYETPKLVKIGDRSSDRYSNKSGRKNYKGEQFYSTIQEILFTNIIQDSELITNRLKEEWSDDIFLQRPYNTKFWESYNVLLESEEDQKLIEDLTKRASLFKK